MRITVSARKPSALDVDYVVLLWQEKRDICHPAGKILQEALAAYGKSVKAGRMQRMDQVAGGGAGKKPGTLLLSPPLSSRKSWPECERIRGVAAEALKYCKSGDNRKVAFLLNGADGARLAPWIAEGLVLGGYSYSDYKAKPSRFGERFSAEIVVAQADLEATSVAVADSIHISECANLARDLINKPGSVATPAYLAEAALKVAKEAGLDAEVWDEKRLQEEGFTGLLTVGRGGTTPPRMVVIRHNPPGAVNEKHLCLLGKGLTFDTGGLCLKTGASMWEMVSDMSGAAAVIGAMKAIGQGKPNLRVTGIVVTAQNYVGPDAMMPGDCFLAKNGKGIHVLNTDAEGRLILIDGLARAGEEGATHIVDAATLTGSCVRALGESLSGLFCNDRPFARRLWELGEATGEQMWEMPLFEDYVGLLDHHRADLNNVSKGPNAGAITGALFLREFVPKGAIWAHLDIAGTSFDESSWRYFAPGGRGVMVRTFNELARQMAAEPER